MQGYLVLPVLMQLVLLLPWQVLPWLLQLPWMVHPICAGTHMLCINIRCSPTCADAAGAAALAGAAAFAGAAAAGLAGSGAFFCSSSMEASGERCDYRTSSQQQEQWSVKWPSRSGSSRHQTAHRQRILLGVLHKGTPTPSLTISALSFSAAAL